MTIEQAILSAISKKAVLFLGAGFSADTINLDDEQMKDSRSLCKFLCDDINIRHDDLALVTDMYINDNINGGAHKLVKKLQNKYTFKKFSDPKMTPQIPITKLPWMRVYTTNYDNVFERSSEQVNKKRTPITLSESVRDYYNHDIVLHINGYIDTLTTSKLKNEFKLTSTSYLVEDFVKSDWFTTFKNDIDLAEAIIFVGVSFKYDVQIQKIIYNAENFREKILFIDRVLSEEELKDPTINYWKKQFGEVYNIGLLDFSKMIEQSLEKNTVKDIAYHFSNFELVNKLPVIYERNVPSKKLWDLLSYGTFDNSLIYNNEYIFKRDVINEILNNLSQSQCHCICILSDMANGKTCLLQKLSSLLCSKGTVFRFSNPKGNFRNDIREICKNPGQNYILIDNYNHHTDLLKVIGQENFNANLKIILSCRSFVHDTLAYKLKDLLAIDPQNIYEYNIDTLAQKDIQNFLPILKRSALLSHLRNRSAKQIERLLSKDCNSQLRDILLEVVKSEAVSSKILNAFDAIKDKNTIKLIIAIFICTITQSELSLNDLQNILEIGSLSISQRSDENVNLFININGNNIAARSSILACFVIQKRSLNLAIIDTLYLLNENASLCANQIKIKQLRRNLISFSNINMLVPNRSDQCKFQILEYYNNLTEVSEYKNNPFFWVQYAIASMDANEYERAAMVLDIAEQIPNEQYISEDFDNYQAETQRGRLLLESACYAKICDTPYDTIKEAHILLMGVLMREKGQAHLVFRQFEKYAEFFNIFKTQFDSDQKNKLIGFCDDIISKLNNYLKNERRMREAKIVTSKRIEKFVQLKKDIFLSSVTEYGFVQV